VSNVEGVLKNINLIQKMDPKALGEGQYSLRCALVSWVYEQRMPLYCDLEGSRGGLLGPLLYRAADRKIKRIQEKLCRCKKCDFLNDNGPVLHYFKAATMPSKVGRFREARLIIKIPNEDGVVREEIDLSTSSRVPVRVDWWETGWQLHVVVPYDRQELEGLDLYDRSPLATDWWHTVTVTTHEVRIPLEVGKIQLSGHEYKYWYDVPLRGLRDMCAIVYPESELSKEVLRRLYGKEVKKVYG